jgi:hypothetical protein
VVLREILSRVELAPVSTALARPVPRGPTLAPRGGACVRVVRKLARSREVAATPAA